MKVLPVVAAQVAKPEIVILTQQVVGSRAQAIISVTAPVKKESKPAWPESGVPAQEKLAL